MRRVAHWLRCRARYPPRSCGVMRLALPRSDKRIQIVDRRIDGGADRNLAVVAGPFVGGDDRYLIAGDATCRALDARVIALGRTPVGPSGPLTCPVGVRSPRTARSGGSIAVAVTCPRGCRASIELQVLRPTGAVTFGFGRSGWSSRRVAAALSTSSSRDAQPSDATPGEPSR